MSNSYEYDNNGNILYVNTLRLKPDMTAQPDTVQRTREERFRWDEENRLTALSQNGYVSHYWYDADGEPWVESRILEIGPRRSLTDPVQI